MFEINQENRNDLREAMQVSLSALANRSDLVTESFSEFVKESATYEQLLNLTFTDRKDSSYTDSGVLESEVFELMDNMTNGKLSVVESYDDASEYLSVLTEQMGSGIGWGTDAQRAAGQKEKRRARTAPIDREHRKPSEFDHGVAAGARAGIKGGLIVGAGAGVAASVGVAALGTIGYYLYKKFRKSGMSDKASKAKAMRMSKNRRR